MCMWKVGGMECPRGPQLSESRTLPKESCYLKNLESCLNIKLSGFSRLIHMVQLRAETQTIVLST